ncbi:hypothetical protein PRECH8_07340 [Insulibacter thermoxylanivorax]|uniref:Uncharacterized protein n=1 Tax=Insulibacter thermoxylanivorax TaxID=2749268 RepID=A0A916QDL2_9BACL|nr:hypothetical protein [Insulibacter thermoxylanivorax]GFR37438.1 hypothetical protein PRECH8_07340 [Insulibacter thermoxylanivorax]
MRLHDALFNWLQMAIVVEGRPDDRSAHDTLNFFAEILAEDHQVDRVEIIKKDDTMIHVRYGNAEGTKVQLFNREAAEQLLHEINANPKYNS